MTLVVADTGPLRYLAVTQFIHLLPSLFETIVVPEAVLSELTHPHAPSAVREWAVQLPPWAKVRKASRVELASVLDPGEAEAIALAEELKARMVLIDEREARKEAARRGIPVIGTVAILEEAASKDLIDLPEAYRRLLATNFRIDRRFLDEALRRDAARRAGRSERERHR